MIVDIERSFDAVGTVDPSMHLPLTNVTSTTSSSFTLFQHWYKAVCVFVHAHVHLNKLIRKKIVPKKKAEHVNVKCH